MQTTIKAIRNWIMDHHPTSGYGWAVWVAILGCVLFLFFFFKGKRKVPTKSANPAGTGSMQRATMIRIIAIILALIALAISAWYFVDMYPIVGYIILGIIVLIILYFLLPFLVNWIKKVWPARTSTSTGPSPSRTTTNRNSPAVTVFGFLIKWFLIIGGIYGVCLIYVYVTYGTNDPTAPSSSGTTQRSLGTVDNPILITHGTNMLEAGKVYKFERQDRVQIYWTPQEPYIATLTRNRTGTNETWCRLFTNFRNGRVSCDSISGSVSSKAGWYTTTVDRDVKMLVEFEKLKDFNWNQ